MEIPVLNRIGDFEAGITSLQNPSFISQALTFSGVERIHQAYGFWKWGALILALVASFSTIINRIKILIIRIKNRFLTPPSLPPISPQHYDSDAESDVSCSSSSSISDDGEEEDEQATSSSLITKYDEDYTVKGSGHRIHEQWQTRNLRRRRNSSFEDLLSQWSEFKNGKNVVKLWDNLGFGFGLNLENNSTNSVSLYDMNKELNLFSISGEKSDIPAVFASSSSPAVIVSAETNETGHLLKLWDTRVGSRIPEILAEWRPRLGKFVGISGGRVEKVYVRDEVTGKLTVSDLRNVKSPLVTAMETDVDTWWDADGVSAEEEDE